MKDLILYGAGGHCFAMVDLIRSIGNLQVIQIYDDAPKNGTILDVPVSKYNGEDLSQATICISVGNNEVRRKLSEKFDADFPILTHPSAVVYPSVSIGKGTTIMAQTVIDADVSLGRFCIVNHNATVAHNVVVGDYCHIAINAAVAGGVTIGEGTLVGAGSVILPGIAIGKGATIGAGAVVTKDVPDGAMVYGNPAKIIR
ncbi:acetyltransferase [Aureisphaera galaxeae]|uniref:acetyltransferase n=1 Tax=Aureisphaera galaxeae TaxID=1538023 RepID=UPI002350B1BC|nr:acetyltransferase [Aureisphaera galaxeae]MDC8004586.1 acetyltransferase [Aureisphaera galaxeae]